MRFITFQCKIADFLISGLGHSCDQSNGVTRMFRKDMTIAGFDDELWAAIEAEGIRQEEHIELIA